MGFEAGAPELERMPERMESRPKAPWWEECRPRRLPPPPQRGQPRHGYSITRRRLWKASMGITSRLWATADCSRFGAHI